MHISTLYYTLFIIYFYIYLYKYYPFLLLSCSFIPIHIFASIFTPYSEEQINDLNTIRNNKNGRYNYP